VVADHKNDINNGALILWNNEWGSAFMEYWMELSSNRTNYPFTDNGGFAAAVLRFGAQSMPSDCAYTYETCVEEMRAKYKTIKAMNGAFVKCVRRLKQRIMGPWYATTHRDSLHRDSDGLQYPRLGRMEGQVWAYQRHVLPRPNVHLAQQVFRHARREGVNLIPFDSIRPASHFLRLSSR